jgi:hypothetical protein
MPASPLRPPRAPWKIAAGLTVTGVLLFLAGVAVVVATGSHYVRPTVDLSSTEAESAYEACQAYARKDLKAPGPVTFEPLRRWNVRRYMDGRVRVRASADGVNGAGRAIDLRVACRLRPIGAGRWELESLSVSTD